MQNVLQNMPLQNFFAKFLHNFLYNFFSQFFGTMFAKFLQIDLGFGHEVPIFWLMLFSRRGCRMTDWLPSVYDRYTNHAD